MRIPTHPGEIIKDETEARGMTPHAFAMAIRVPASRIDQIIKGRRRVSLETAVRLATYLGGDPAVWLTMQNRHDLAIFEMEHGEKIRRDVHAASP